MNHISCFVRSRGLHGNPGKYVESWDPDAPPGKLSERVQRPAVLRVVELARTAPPGLDFDSLRRRHDCVLDASGARRLPASTAGPLTLHLARASALENAGICLHPIYGFVHLPGSGVKGLAHSYACEVWLPAQSDQEAAWAKVCAAFGWAPSPWLKDLARRHGRKAPEDASAGAIVFHDAWPDSWPRLILDILNNHHAGYYQKGEPPGDWDNPVPVYFLAVSAGQKFTFALSKRRQDVPDDLLDLCVQWLAGGLTHLGAGAKTATGYGAFKTEGLPAPATASPHRPEFACTLELVTPAFLAGAAQQADDCELRPATLRGLLRWWWRTLHTGFVDTGTLARMEAAVWGDVSAGGAVRLTVEPLSEHKPLRFDKQFLQRHNQLPLPPNTKTTQGLWYHAFGMDDTKSEGGQKMRSQRWYLPPGARWTVRLTARPTYLLPPGGKGEARRIDDAGLILDQARAALALLCRFGGVGAKVRKGFGSLAEPPELKTLDLDAYRRLAARFREACGLGVTKFNPSKATSPSLELALPPLEVPVGWGNYWLALDQVGDAGQRFAQQRKHQLEKKGLGLPRRIGQPTTGSFKPGPHVKDRHAAPIHFHLDRDASGLGVRVLAFIAAELPDRGASELLLKDLLKHLQAELPARFTQHAVLGKRPPANPTAGPAEAAAATPTRMPAAGERVQAVLLEEKTKGGGWKARHAATGRVGPIVNSNDVPGDRKAGDEVELIVASINPTAIQFRFPTAQDTGRSPKGPGRGGPPNRGRR
jgi:CRISPR-associated protein Cmr6